MLLNNLKKLCSVDETIFSRSSNRDKTFILLLLLFVPISAIIAGYSFFYSVQFVLESTFLALTIGVLVFIGVLFHDKTLLDTFSTGKIVGRVIFSIMIALVLNIPYKVNLSKDSISLKMLQEIREYNNSIDASILEEEKELYHQEEILMANVTQAAGYYDKTGKAQKLADARRELASFKEQKELVLASLNENNGARKKEADLSKLSMAGYYMKNMFNTESPAELFINLFVFLLLLTLESSPALIRLLINNGDYIRIKNHLEKIAKKADTNMWKLDELLLTDDGIKHLPKLLAEREVWRIMKAEAGNDFKNPNELIRLMGQAGMSQVSNQQNSRDEGAEASTDEHPSFLNHY